jgi:hypothetical protein
MMLPGVDQGQSDALPHLCFDCLRGHPEHRFFKILPGCRKPPRDITQRRIEEATALRSEGLTYREIGERFGVGHVPVQTWLKPDLAERGRADGRKWYATSKGQAKADRDRAYKVEHPLYVTWVAMRHRCYAPTAESYPNYGARGIAMHPTWENSFDTFESWIYANLGRRPEGIYKNGHPMYELDRIDNDGNYEPGNVRWATRKVQQNNKRQPVKNATAELLRAQLRSAGLEPCA